MEIIFAMFGFAALIVVYWVLRSLFTGEPGPFDTITYIDDGYIADYLEIIEHLDNQFGPSIILKMRFFDFENPSYYQRLLIQKSRENKSSLTIEVYHEE